MGVDQSDLSSIPLEKKESKLSMNCLVSGHFDVPGTIPRQHGVSQLFLASYKRYAVLYHDKVGRGVKDGNRVGLNVRVGIGVFVEVEVVVCIGDGVKDGLFINTVASCLDAFSETHPNNNKSAKTNE